MKEYLKMSDGFYDLDIGFLEQRLFSGLVSKEECTYAAHAINSHDELVAEVERLRYHLRACATELAKMIDAHNEQNVDDGSWKYDHQTPFEAIRYLGEIRD